MKTNYSKKQIQESIAYWKYQLKNGNYIDNDSCILNENKISDFFGKIFKTKKFLDAQKELLK